MHVCFWHFYFPTHKSVLLLTMFQHLLDSCILFSVCMAFKKHFLSWNLAIEQTFSGETQLEFCFFVGKVISLPLRYAHCTAHISQRKANRHSHLVFSTFKFAQLSFLQIKCYFCISCNIFILKMMIKSRQRMNEWLTECKIKKTN